MVGQQEHTEEVKSCAEKVQQQGHDEESSWAICIAQFKEAGKPVFRALEERVVEGYASTIFPDFHGTVFSQTAVKEAFGEFLKKPNFTYQHLEGSRDNVAQLLEHRFDEVGVYIKAKVTDDATWEAVKSGQIRGFSLKGKILQPATLCAGKICLPKFDRITLSSIGLVSNPSCNPWCEFTVIRSQVDMEFERKVEDFHSQVDNLIRELREKHD